MAFKILEKKNAAMKIAALLFPNVMFWRLWSAAQNATENTSYPDPTSVSVATVACILAVALVVAPHKAFTKLMR
jgi:hypothetical protein